MNVFPVSIYEDAGRTDKLTDVAAFSYSGIETAPNSRDTVFYLTYHVTVEGITFPYYDNTTVVAARIDENRFTDISIPPLEQGEVSRVYVKIVNNGVTSLAFKYGNSVLMPAGSASSLVLNGEPGVSTRSPGPATGYAFMKNGIQELAFPDGFSEFQAGHIYSFSFNGSSVALERAQSIAIAAIVPARLEWSGGWHYIAPKTYKHNWIEGVNSTMQTLTITTAVPRLLTVELTASVLPNHVFYGYTSEMNDDTFSGLSGYVINATSNQISTHTYTIPIGTHRIHFKYIRNLVNSSEDDSVMVKILSIDLPD
jgi:hypothetical protein